jgi:hypothetical protein
LQYCARVYIVLVLTEHHKHCSEIQVPTELPNKI